MELLNHETRRQLESIKTGLRVNEMISANSKWVGLLLLTLDRSKTADSVHLILEGKTTDAGLGLRAYSVYQEKKTRRGGKPYRHWTGQT